MEIGWIFNKKIWPKLRANNAHMATNMKILTTDLGKILTQYGIIRVYGILFADSNKIRLFLSTYLDLKKIHEFLIKIKVTYIM